MSLTILQHRILEISYQNRLSHIGSCLGCVGILDTIYAERGKHDPVILSMGHGGVGLYVVLEKHLGLDAQILFELHGVHPRKDSGNGVWCSVGSLGQGLTIAVGRALANRDHNVHCVISDGEAAEGCVYEALNFARNRGLTNLHVHASLNGFGAYRPISATEQSDILSRLYPDIKIHHTTVTDIPFLTGQAAHYHVMSDEDWAWVEAQEVVA